MYKYQTVIRLHHTDAAGVIYFANLFVLAHVCYEAFFEQHTSIGSILEQDELLVPIVHADADYLMPLRVSDKISIEMAVTKIGKSSFELGFTFSNESSQITAKVKTIHVVIAKDTRKPVAIPQFIKGALETL